MPPPCHLAIVDDEPDVTGLLARYFTQHGFRVTPLQRGTDLAATMATDPAALVLLDLGLPGEDGFALARQVKERWNCGLIIVTGRGDAVDKVVGLEVGADDYVTKPFDLRELLARVRAVLRRTEAPAGGAVSVEPRDGPLRFLGWTLDANRRALLDPRGAEVALTCGEFDLLTVFAEHAGRVLSRDFILGRTRGRDASPFDRTIDVQVGRLRRKLGDDADAPQIIKSVRGAGYLFVPPVARAPS